MNAKPATTPNASATQPALSKIDIAAMKTADSVCFRKCKGEAGSTIECNKEFERTEKNPFARTETITLREIIAAIEKTELHSL